LSLPSRKNKKPARARSPSRFVGKNKTLAEKPGPFRCVAGAGFFKQRAASPKVI